MVFRVIFILILSLLFSVNIYSQEHYYYYKGEKYFK